MNSNDCSDFNWNELLAQINMKKVIPVIGQGLYWILNSDNKEVLLYQFLAEKLAIEKGLPPPGKNNHAFSRTVFRYLEKNPNDYDGIRRFLTENLAALKPVSEGSMWKLARIRPFSLFINTTYDHFLESILKKIRKYPTEVLHHTYTEKQTDKVTPERFESLNNSRSSLVLHIYGSADRNMSPAYTEKDILETVVTLQNDIVMDPNNRFFQALKEKSLLFIGLGYDDWLFRFFIRTIAYEPYQRFKNSRKCKFISDDFDPFKHGDLICFLKTHGSQVFYPGSSKDFVDKLFEKMESEYPGNIIHKDEFPETAFISFHGADREAAEQLASKLQKDGIEVWFDELELEPGDEVDKTIITAIEKCSVFIPLVSEKAKQFQVIPNTLKYHIREWERANSEHLAGKNPMFIIPVIIEHTDWMYEPFNGLDKVCIYGERREENYKKLKNRLLEIQDKRGNHE